MPFAKRGARAAVDVEDRARGIVEQRARRAVQVAHLREQLAHLARARARGRLVSHRRHPLDEARAEQAAEGHQHQAHGAVAADPVAAARAASAASITGRLTGSRMITVSSFRRSCDAASIQWPRQPRARSFGCTASVYSPPWQEMRMSQRASASRSFASPTVAAPCARRRAPRRPPASSKKTRARSARNRLPRACARRARNRPCRASRSVPSSGIAAIDSPVALQSAHYSVPDGEPNNERRRTPQLSIPPEAAWGPTFDVGARDRRVHRDRARRRPRKIRRVLRGRLLDRALVHADHGRALLRCCCASGSRRACATGRRRADAGRSCSRSSSPSASCSRSRC